MRRLSSGTVRIARTAALALALSGLACADNEPDEYTEVQTEYGEICARHDFATGEDIRVDDNYCGPDGIAPGGGYALVWVNQAHGHRSPAVGQPLAKGTATWAKPASGTVARPPATGGFGTFRATTGG